MAALSKQKYVINHVPTEVDKKKSRRISADSNTFFFKDDVNKWHGNKSVFSSRNKPLF